MKDRIARYQAEVSASSSGAISQPLIRSDGDVLVELKDVNVSYHERKVSTLSLVFPVVRHKHPRSCKKRTGRYGQVKGGTFRGQMVRLTKVSCVFVVWMTNNIV